MLSLSFQVTQEIHAQEKQCFGDITITIKVLRLTG